MHVRHLAIWLSLGCSERVLIAGKIPQNEKAGRLATSNWAKLLQEASTEEGVDYVLIDQNRFILESYLKWMGEHGPIQDKIGESAEDKAMSQMINAFNAAAVYSVIEHQPQTSILEIDAGFTPWEGGGFWWGQRFRIDGEWIHLEYLMEQSIIGRYQSALPHIALNPAIRGAPQLKWWDPHARASKEAKIWRMQNRKLDLDAHFFDQWRSWLATEHGMMETDTGYAVSSLLFDWEDDILAWSESETLCDWLLIFAQDEKLAWLEANQIACPLTQFHADWSLNQRVDVEPSQEG